VELGAESGWLGLGGGVVISGGSKVQRQTTDGRSGAPVHGWGKPKVAEANSRQNKIKVTFGCVEWTCDLIL